MSSIHDDLARYQKQVNFNFENFANATEAEILTMNLVSQNSIQDNELVNPENVKVALEKPKGANQFLHVKGTFSSTLPQDKYVLA